jgi:alkylated DNA repair dioxygenase AlkB
MGSVSGRDGRPDEYVATTPISASRDPAASHFHDMAQQLGLFGGGPALPPGFNYQPDLLTAAEESDLIDNVKLLPFQEVVFHGYVGNRRVVSFGWQYDFNEEALRKTDDIPSFLRSLRQTAARFADMPAAELQHVLVTKYAPGAGIGWHRDKGVFGQVVGISLLSPCIFRLRRKHGDTHGRASVRLPA